MDSTAPARFDRLVIQLREPKPIVRDAEDAGNVGEFSEWLRMRRAQRENFASFGRPAPR